MTSRVAMLWAVLIAFCVAPAHSQIGGANVEALTLSQNESDEINSIVDRIADGVIFGEKQGKDVISSVKPYSGMTPFARNGIEYEIFPTLGFFRIRSLRGADDADWLYIAWFQEDTPVVVQKDANASNFELSKTKNSDSFSAHQPAFIFRQKEQRDLVALQRAFRLPDNAVEAIRRFKEPAAAQGAPFLCWERLDEHDRVTLATNQATPEMLYVSASCGEHFEERRATLAKYDDVLEGVIAEARK